MLGDIHEVHDLDVEALGAGRSPGLTPHPDPVFAVCTHGRHDTCCAERGRPVAAALAAAHPDLTWEVSHIGGDRFAANALVLPHGLYYGRLDEASVLDWRTRTWHGRLSLDHLRGRSGLGTPAAVRRGRAAPASRRVGDRRRAVPVPHPRRTGPSRRCSPPRGAAYAVRCAAPRSAAAAPADLLGDPRQCFGEARAART